MPSEVERMRAEVERLNAEARRMSAKLDVATKERDKLLAVGVKLFEIAQAIENGATVYQLNHETWACASCGMTCHFGPDRPHADQYDATLAIRHIDGCVVPDAAIVILQARAWG